VTIRPAEPGDHGAIREVIGAAFERGGSVEALIVEGVRTEGAALVELVAQDADRVVGHILFSRMTCAPPRFLAGLGPLAVHPEYQKLGTGAALSRAGLDGCRRLGVEAVVVLGHPAYYARFGFSAASARRVQSPYSGSSAFMALELTPGALNADTEVAYPSAFG